MEEEGLTIVPTAEERNPSILALNRRKTTEENDIEMLEEELDNFN